MGRKRNLVLHEYVAPEAMWHLKIEALCQTALDLVAQLQIMAAPGRVPVEQGLDLPAEVRRFETELIECALRCTGGHQQRAARLLGLKPSTLNAKMKQYGISSRVRATATPVLRLAARQGLT